LDADYGDLKGILNMLKMPCRLCGEKGSYDQYIANPADMKELGTYDGWSTMKALAKYEGVAWNPSPDNTWRSEEEIEASRKIKGVMMPETNEDYDIYRTRVAEEHVKRHKVSTATIVEHILDTYVYKYICVDRGDQYQPPQFEGYCSECEEFKGDGHIRECKSGIIEDFLDANENQIEQWVVRRFWSEPLLTTQDIMDRFRVRKETVYTWRRKKWLVGTPIMALDADVPTNYRYSLAEVEKLWTRLEGMHRPNHRG
jgi:hypothetical protein